VVESVPEWAPKAKGVVPIATGVGALAGWLWWDEPVKGVLAGIGAGVWISFFWTMAEWNKEIDR
jgi:hypothetical protein